MIRALEATGVPNAEDTVRADIEGLLPAIARRLILHRLAGVLAEQGDEATPRTVAGAVVDLLTGQREGSGDLPGWELIETNGTHAGKPIRLTADDVPKP
jgi:hypothetical protein